MRAAKAHGLAIHYWTINDEDVMRELIEKGADGIMTDRPTLLRQILDEKED
jgi:glycerophosphoryl diester phosphodiesterase